MLKRTYTALACCLVLQFFWMAPLGLPAEEDRKDESSDRGKGRERRPRKSAKDLYAVVQVGDEIKVISNSELTSLRRESSDKYMEELKVYEQARRAAAKKKEKFDKPKPQRPVIRVLASKLPSEEAALKKKESFENKIQSKERYALVKVGDEVKIIKNSELERLKSQLDSKYQRDLKAYGEAKKAAVKNKEKFNQPKPVRQLYKILAKNLTLEAATVRRDLLTRKSAVETPSKKKTTEKQKKEEEIEIEEEESPPEE